MREIDDQDLYCDAELIRDMIEAKNVFDHLKDRELHDARQRANPYETIKGAIFQNRYFLDVQFPIGWFRAAMKTANLDRIYGWRLSHEFDDKARRAKNPYEKDDVGLEKPRENVTRHHGLFYFADVCAGPGGFSEYMLWRKAFYNAKGIGFTLKSILFL